MSRPPFAWIGLGFLTLGPGDVGAVAVGELAEPFHLQRLVIDGAGADQVRLVRLETDGAEVTPPRLPVVVQRSIRVELENRGNAGATVALGARGVWAHSQHLVDQAIDAALAGMPRCKKCGQFLTGIRAEMRIERCAKCDGRRRGAA